MTTQREYVEGKRKKYFPPLNFFLIVAAIYVLVNAAFFHVLPIEILAKSNLAAADVAKIIF